MYPTTTVETTFDTAVTLRKPILEETFFSFTGGNWISYNTLEDAVSNGFYAAIREGVEDGPRLAIVFNPQTDAGRMIELQARTEIGILQRLEEIWPESTGIFPRQDVQEVFGRAPLRAWLQWKSEAARMSVQNMVLQGLISPQEANLLFAQYDYQIASPAIQHNALSVEASAEKLLIEDAHLGAWMQSGFTDNASRDEFRRKLLSGQLRITVGNLGKPTAFSEEIATQIQTLGFRGQHSTMNEYLQTQRVFLSGGTSAAVSLAELERAGVNTSNVDEVTRAIEEIAEQLDAQILSPDIQCGGTVTCRIGGGNEIHFRKPLNAIDPLLPTETATMPVSLPPELPKHPRIWYLSNLIKSALDVLGTLVVAWDILKLDKTITSSPAYSLIAEGNLTSGKLIFAINPVEISEALMMRKQHTAAALAEGKVYGPFNQAIFLLLQRMFPGVMEMFPDSQIPWEQAWALLDRMLEQEMHVVDKTERSQMIFDTLRTMAEKNQAAFSVAGKMPSAIELKGIGGEFQFRDVYFQAYRTTLNGVDALHFVMRKLPPEAERKEDTDYENPNLTIVDAYIDPETMQIIQQTVNPDAMIGVSIELPNGERKYICNISEENGKLSSKLSLHCDVE